MRLLFATLAILFMQMGQVSAQKAKLNPPTKHQIDPALKTIKTPANRSAVPSAIDPFQTGDMQYKTMESLNRSESKGEWLLMLDEEDRTTFATTTNPEHQIALVQETPENHLRTFLNNLPMQGIRNPGTEFVLSQATIDEQGNSHFRMIQTYQGLPVFGSEIILHSKGNTLHKMNGRYENTPSGLNTAPTLSTEQAREIIESAYGKSRIKTTWSDADLRLVGGQPYKSDLVVYYKEGKAHLAYQVVIRPNVMNRWEYMIDAHNGEILNQLDRTCRIHPGVGGHEHTHTASNMPPTAGPVTGTGLDLFDVNRSFGAYEVNGTRYLHDASKQMFNSGASQFPGNPVGVLATLDAKNTSPQNSNFNYVDVTSSSNTFTNKKAAISAHYNASKCYDYFQSTFNRKSIDGVGGNIISLVNVSEEDGSSMENAFWNGDAMWYGNGGSFFLPLARGLDVGGHEMTHGVIEKTANLVYQNQSGALNESFADIFGVMIDRDDWKIGEDVVKPGISPNGCLRSMQDPNNGDTQGGNFWQPKHMNTIYTGTQDNGGVHINSGITNHAFYLFAINSAVGKEKAEQVYYKALRDYLTMSSKFIDCRVAVIQASNDLYGAAVANAAAAAFDAVGIAGPSSGGGSGGTTTPPPGNLNVNPGTDLVLLTTENGTKLQLANGSGAILGDLYTEGVISRPSITDNGDYVVFVNSAKKIIGIGITYQGNQIIPATPEVLGDSPVWSNVAISKDGRYLAAVDNTGSNTILIVDFQTNQQKEFILYNPTYTQGQITNNVDYADVLEFDYNGKSLMYDARNVLKNETGQDISYWDISFLNFSNGSSFTSGTNIISKLFNGLPENVSVGNPTFSKNSPYIIAFDVIDGNNGTYDIYGANIETGDNSAIVTNNGDTGVPNYNRLDNAIIFETPFSAGGYDIYRKPIAANKISGAGNATIFSEAHIFGVWYGTGTRSILTKVDDPTLNAGLTVAPNPTADGVWFDLDAKEQVKIEVWSTDGRLLRQIVSGISDEKMYLPMNDYPAGTYHLRLSNSKGTRTARVIKL